jgi:hypothetical protein
MAESIELADEGRARGSTRTAWRDLPFGVDAEELVRQKWRLLNPSLDERARRLWAGAEVGAIGYGGVAAVARATGMAISTVRKGRDDACAGARHDDVVKVRRSNGKRPFEVAHPTIWPAHDRKAH